MPYTRAPHSAIRISSSDTWVRDVKLTETVNSIVVTAPRVTLQRVIIDHTVPNVGASKPADFSLEAGQILLDRCESTVDNTYWVWTGSLDAGPFVLLNCTFNGDGRVEPHLRWATGMLVDNCKVPGGGIDLMNRGVMGSGHGWTMAWGVAWNCEANYYVIQNPPGAMNWAIGCVGEHRRRTRPFDESPELPHGTYDSVGMPVTPRSLYLTQLAERLGPQAVRNLGY